MSQEDNLIGHALERATTPFLSPPSTSRSNILYILMAH